MMMSPGRNTMRSARRTISVSCSGFRARNRGNSKNGLTRASIAIGHILRIEFETGELGSDRRNGERIAQRARPDATEAELTARPKENSELCATRETETRSTTDHIEAVGSTRAVDSLGKSIC